MATIHTVIARVLSKIKFANIGYSQEGEDLIIDRLLDYKATGFFIDVGAHHPYRFSNTYRFYLRGWKGINIDAMPGSMQLFNKLRPRDTNIETPVSDKEEELTYYIFNEPALNTFSADEANRKKEIPQYRVIETKKLITQPLDKILDSSVPASQKIDFLSIDVEGLDLKVLRSNNWAKYKPTLVLVELLIKNNNIENILTDETYLFMKQQGYSLCAKTLNTLFFKLDHAN